MYLFRFNLFWEVLVLLEDRKWVYPSYVPLKYIGRCKTSSGDTYWVNSKRHTETYCTNVEALKDGMWICEDDFTPRGNVGATVFGMPLPPNPFPLHQDQLSTWATGINVRVAYHGTSKECFKQIVKSELKCTFGMLGTGIYVGSFWKACRFAARDQSYEIRSNPTVLRILWTCKEEDILMFPRKFIDGYCFCAKCYLNPEQQPFCAHVADFTRDAKFPPQKPYGKGPWKAGQLFPCKYPSGKWVTQNEEWIINPSLVLSIEQAMELDKDSLRKPHYDPLQRDILVV